MPNQIVLSWSVSVAKSSRTPAQAAAALAAVQLFANPTTDPVLGQLFGLTVASDVTTPTGGGATRTLTLNMTSNPGAPFAPPPFPCNPTTSTPPVLPFTFTKTTPLAGSFLVMQGSMVVPTTVSQIPAIPATGGVVRFDAQIGVDYPVALITPGTINLSVPFTGRSANSPAVLVSPAPAKIAAMYSSSPLDDAAGSGAHTVVLSYVDSLGTPGTVVVSLRGKRPSLISLAGGTVDIATVTDMHVTSVGGFGNSVGQITLSELSSAVLTDDTLDQAQMKLLRPLVYLPPSFFALAQPQTSAPQLAGDFLVTTGSTSVPTTVDQTGALAAGNVIQFASQLENDTPFGAEPVLYTLAAVTPKQLTLQTAYTGLVPGSQAQIGDTGAQGVKGTKVINLPTGAFKVTPSPAASPTNGQLAGTLAQFVNPSLAIPPPNPPLQPSTMNPTPTFLSGLFTQTLQDALATPVTPAPITFI